MKFTIMTRILFMLLASERVTAKEIAEKFNISQRSVYRYIDDLSLAHVPIVTERGTGGGISIRKGYKLPASFLTKSEYERLKTLIDGFSKQMGDDEELCALSNKLFSATKHYDMPSLKSSTLIIDGSGWFDLGGYNEKFALISKAINEQIVLKIVYHNRNGQVTERDVEPHAIVLKHGVWYVYSYCRIRKGFRLFRVSRIVNAVEGESFERREFDSDALDLNEWLENVEKEEIEFIADMSIRSDLEDWLGVENVSVIDNGKIRVECSMPYDRALISEIMKYGKKIKVVRPEKLKKDILDNAKQILKMYCK